MISISPPDIFDEDRFSSHVTVCESFNYGDSEVVEVEKVEKGRERNREHAKRTRLRKKAVLEGMKGKLMELQNEASKLQQSFEERNTANILLCLCSKAQPDAEREEVAQEDVMKVEPGFDPSVKGNIIQQLRTKVRSEAAQKYQEHAALARSRNSGILLPDPPTSSSFAAYTDAAHLDTDCDSDNEDDEAFQPLAKSIVNWKNGTVISEEGTERKLSNEEMEHLRKERNRVHAKLTRDRKKLFTSRMQQMINSLERQNIVMKSKLKSLVGAGEPPNADREQRIDGSQEQLSSLIDYPRQSIGLHHFNNKFVSGFSATLLEVLNKNIGDSSDCGVVDSRHSIIHGLSNPFPDSDSKRQRTGHYMNNKDMTSNMQDISNPFLGTLGPLNRTYQNDMFPPSGDCQKAHFTASALPSFFEAL